MKTLSAKKSRNFTEGPMLPQIILFALPLMATGILQMLFNTADTIVVGRWGGDTQEACENALAAVGSCGSLNSLLVTCFTGLSIGAGICAAHDIGAKDYKGLEDVVHTSLLTSIIAGIALTIVGLVFCRPLLVLMGTNEAVLDQAVAYMRALFCGAPANMVYCYCAAILRSKGDSSHPLLFLTIAGVTNVVLNLIMVLVFRLGAVGVGIATAAAHWISAILVVWHMMKNEDLCRIDLKKLRISPQKLKKMIYIGVPASIQGIAFSLSNVIIQSSVNSLGKAVVAADAAAANITNYLYIAENSLYQCALTFVGQNVGARKYKRILPCAWQCVGVVTVVGLVLGALVTLFAEPLLNLYVPGNTEVIGFGKIRILYLGLTYFLCGVMEVGSGVLRGLGKAISSMVISLIGTCLLRVVWIMVVFRSVGTLESLYLSYPLSWIATAVALFWMAWVIVRRLLASSPKDAPEESVKETEEASVPTK